MERNSDFHKINLLFKEFRSKRVRVEICDEYKHVVLKFDKIEPAVRFIVKASKLNIEFSNIVFDGKEDDDDIDDEDVYEDRYDYFVDFKKIKYSQELLEASNALLIHDALAEQKNENQVDEATKTTPTKNKKGRL